MNAGRLDGFWPYQKERKHQTNNKTFSPKIMGLLWILNILETIQKAKRKKKYQDAADELYHIEPHPEFACTIPSTNDKLINICTKLVHVGLWHIA